MAQTKTPIINTQLDTLNANVTAANTAITDGNAKLEAGLNAANTNLDAIGDNVAAVGTKLDTANTQQAATNEKLGTTNTNLESIATQEQTANAKRDTANTNLANMVAQETAANTKRDTANTKLEAISGKIADSRSQLETLNENLLAIGEKFDTMNGKFGQLIDKEYAASEAWAVGTKDGAAVPESDETYHNNSKYYAESAGASATVASTSASSIQTSMEKIDSFDERLTQLEKASALCIGIKRKCQADGTPQSDTKWTRWGQYANAVVEFARGTEEVQNDLMNVYPYNACRPCNLALGDDGEPVAYLGDADFDWYAETGVAAGTSVMLEVPTEWYAAHWFETDANGQNWEYKCIADSPRYPHSVYIKEEMKRPDGTYTDYFYFPIFLGYVDADGHYISKAGVQPTYDLSVTNARTKVKTNGANWQIIDVWAWEIITLLCDVMSANEDCKAAFGNGISNWYITANIATAQTSVNTVIVSAANSKSFNIGDVVSVQKSGEWMGQSIAKQRTITAIDTTTGTITLSGDAFTSAVGNVLWREVQTNGETVSMASANGSAGASDYKHSVRTLWIENLYGAMHTGVDGINLKFNEEKMGLEQYACKDPSKYSDAYGDGYELLDNPLPLNSSATNYESSGYIKKMFFDADNPLLEMPDSIGGGSNTYEAAYAWQNKNGQRPFFGGAFYSGAAVSLRFRSCVISFGDAYRYFASRPLRR